MEKLVPGFGRSVAASDSFTGINSGYLRQRLIPHYNFVLGAQ